MNTPHRSDYRPPFPALQATLRSETGQRGPLSALIDTGADATLIPRAWLAEIDAVESGWALLRSHFGERQQAQKFLVELQIGPTVIPGLYVVADESGDELILGRGVESPDALSGRAATTNRPLDRDRRATPARPTRGHSLIFR
jgi:hypothetical protein